MLRQRNLSTARKRKYRCLFGENRFEVLRSNIENAISRGVKVYIFTFENIAVSGATVYSYNISDVSKCSRIVAQP